ncbi:probable prolyl 4-hydroxylase 9 [Impatiens glandulifera]|uniref:probable prolyl 4-hydroxylase 9 n=1 Tax=Impatiens glandulifera TaxID=253017 RepID=UPI001FB17CAB|nr:probable prolyl 4-hydroxylase 9 [Impatiens glandulifera]
MRYHKDKRFSSFKSKKLGLPSVFLLCILFFVAGLYGSTLLTHQDAQATQSDARPDEEEEEKLHTSMKYHKDKRFSSFKSKKLGLPSVFLLCILFFVAGLYGSTLLTHQDAQDTQSDARLLESVVEEEIGYEKDDSLFYGVTGESNVSSVRYQVLSWIPRAFYFPKFASPEQCQAIIEMARPKLKQSTLALRKGETIESTKGERTSTGTFMSASEDGTGILDLVERKIERVTMIPRNHGEAFNILRYEIGQRYVSHYDAFNPAEYGPQKSQRTASFLLYLSDVEEGGETMFPFENGSNMDGIYDYEKCIGLKVKPRVGDGLLFYSLTPDGKIDEKSLHGSCPVIKGEKWVATKWIRDQEQAAN